MLTGLSIRNIVLIERLDLSFSDGLSVLTGETGAGKSILLDSLSLALGARSDSRLLRPGADSGRVTATFELTPDHPVLSVLAEHDLPADDILVLRRVLTADGRRSSAAAMFSLDSPDLKSRTNCCSSDDDHGWYARG